MLKKTYNKLIILLLIIISIFSCKSKQTKSNDFDILLNEALEFTNRGYFQKSIDIIDKLLVEHPARDVIVLYYNLGYNYFKLRDFDKAKNFFDKVDNLFETSKYTKEQKEMYVKFTVLSDAVRKRIELAPIDQKDPYHIKDDIEDFKKNRAKRPKK